MTTKHKKMLKMTHDKGLGLLEHMNILMYVFCPDATAYKKKNAKKKSCGCKHVGVGYEVIRTKAKER